MQLDAGINVYSSLDASGRASGSAVVAAASAHASRVVSDGKSVADGIAPTGAFPEPVVRAFFVGEKTGSLDQELSRLAREYRESALRRLEAISEWLPRFILIGVAVYVGWIVLRSYLGYFQMIQDVIKD
jgi:type II secretory pathway component PulF